MPSIAENLAFVEQRIAAAARAAGRDPREITLVGVTKYADLAATRQLVAAGCHSLGESRPQELWRKAEALADLNIAWHMIGHLQRNKVERTLPCLACWQSGDSRRILQAVAAAAEKQGRVVSTLLEVNVAAEPAKTGFQVDEVPPLLDTLAECRHLRIDGLMAMARHEGSRDDARRDFAALRQLRDRLRAIWHGRFALGELSMGMSGDFELAIAEGATMVRVGSALFEQSL